MGLKKRWYQFLLNHLWVTQLLGIHVLHLPPGIYDFKPITIPHLTIIGAGTPETKIKNNR